MCFKYSNIIIIPIKYLKYDICFKHQDKYFIRNYCKMFSKFARVKKRLKINFIKYKKTNILIYLKI